MYCLIFLTLLFFILFDRYLTPIQHVTDSAKSSWKSNLLYFEQYKFLSSLDGSISDASEMNQDGERLIKTEFGLSIKAYVIPEFTSNIFGTTNEMTKELTPSRVTFGFEGDATDEQVGK